MKGDGDTPASEISILIILSSHSSWFRHFPPYLSPKKRKNIDKFKEDDYNRPDEKKQSSPGRT